MKILLWTLLAIFIIAPIVITGIIILKGKKSTTSSPPTPTPSGEAGSTGKVWGWIKHHITLRGIITLTVGIIIILTVREFWPEEWIRFRVVHPEYFWVSTVGGLTLLCYLFGRKSEHSASSPTTTRGGGHSGHDHEGPGVLTMLVSALVLLYVAVAFYHGYQVTHGNQNLLPVVQTTLPVAPPNASQTFVVMVSPTAWTSVSVPYGMRITYLNDKPVYVRRGTEAPFRDDGVGMRQLSELPTPRTDYFIGDGGTAKVTVFLTPGH